LTNEIGLDATQFNNVNYDPTQRRGVEAEARWKVAPGSLFGLVLNLRNATFVDGAFAGKSVPLVSGRTLTLHWQQDLGNTRTFTWLTQLQSSQRIAGDLDNACPERIGGFGVTRLRYAQELAGWDWALNLNNVFNRQYYNFRTRCDATKRSVYPEAGRTWLMTAQRKF
jgi:iron complex outermembrane receptor protein